MTNFKQVEISVDAKVYGQDALFMRIGVGKAESEKGTYTLSTCISTGAPIVETPEGHYVAFSWEFLINAASQAILEGGQQG